MLRFQTNNISYLWNESSTGWMSSSVVAHHGPFYRSVAVFCSIGGTVWGASRWILVGGWAADPASLGRQTWNARHDVAGHICWRRRVLSRTWWITHIYTFSRLIDDSSCVIVGIVVFKSVLLHEVERYHGYPTTNGKDRGEATRLLYRSAVHFQKQ